MNYIKYQYISEVLTLPVGVFFLWQGWLYSGGMCLIIFGAWLQKFHDRRKKIAERRLKHYDPTDDINNLVNFCTPKYRGGNSESNLDPYVDYTDFPLDYQVKEEPPKTDKDKKLKDNEHRRRY